MKFLVVSLLGFILGAAAGALGLYYNPLTQAAGFTVGDADRSYNYGSPMTAGLAFTHGGQTRLPIYPDAIPQMWEETVSKTALSVLALRGSDGAVSAIASRISLPSEQTELLTRGALLRDNWLISIPGEGSIIVTADSNWWPLLKATLIPVWYFERPFSGPVIYEPTVGPASGGSAAVIGASGSFSGRRGIAAERYQIEAFDRQLGPQRAFVELYLDFDTAPSVAVSSQARLED